MDDTPPRVRHFDTGDGYLSEGVYTPSRSQNFADESFMTPSRYCSYP